jgi:hypothetical protein
MPPIPNKESSIPKKLRNVDGDDWFKETLVDVDIDQHGRSIRKNRGKLDDNVVQVSNSKGVAPSEGTLKKKRGRPPKVSLNETAADEPKLKRGRPPKSWMPKRKHGRTGPANEDVTKQCEDQANANKKKQTRSYKTHDKFVQFDVPEQEVPRKRGRPRKFWMPPKKLPAKKHGQTKDQDETTDKSSDEKRKRGRPRKATKQHFAMIRHSYCDGAVSTNVRIAPIDCMPLCLQNAVQTCLRSEVSNERNPNSLKTFEQTSSLEKAPPSVFLDFFSKDDSGVSFGNDIADEEHDGGVPRVQKLFNLRLLLSDEEDKIVSDWEERKLDKLCIWNGEMNIIYQIVTTER